MFDKLLSVLSKNMGYTAVLVVSILLFAVFSDGLVAGLITAISALLMYTCFVALYKEYKATPAKKSTTSKTTKKTTTKKK